MKFLIAQFLSLCPCFVGVSLLFCIPIQQKPLLADPSLHKGKTCTFQCTADVFDWTTYRLPSLTKYSTINSFTDLHCSRLTEAVIQRANIEKASQCLARGRFDRTWGFNFHFQNSFSYSKAIQPPFKYSYSLKAIFMHCFVVVIKYDEACILGRRRTGRQRATTQSDVRHTVELMLYLIHCHCPDLWCL